MKSGIAWLAQVLLIAALVSAGVGFLRAAVSFLPGLSGLFVGALVGYLITATSRRVPLRYRAGKSLIWLALASTVLYVGVQLLVMGWHQASVVDSPRCGGSPRSGCAMCRTAQSGHWSSRSLALRAEVPCIVRSSWTSGSDWTETEEPCPGSPPGPDGHTS